MSVPEILDSGCHERDKMQFMGYEKLRQRKENSFVLLKEGNLQAMSNSFEVRT